MALTRQSLLSFGQQTNDTGRTRVYTHEVSWVIPICLRAGRSATGESIEQLRFESNSPAAQKLRFSTSQEFDVTQPTLQPGSYTVHAWVTTAGMVPQFSAGIPFIASPKP